MQAREPIPSNTHSKTSSMRHRLLFALGTTHMPQHTMQHAAPDAVQSVASDVVHKCDVSLFPVNRSFLGKVRQHTPMQAHKPILSNTHTINHICVREEVLHTLRHTFINTPCNASRSAFFRLFAFALLRLFFGANIRSKRSVFAPKRKPATNCALL